MSSSYVNRVGLDGIKIRLPNLEVLCRLPSPSRVLRVDSDHSTSTLEGAKMLRVLLTTLFLAILQGQLVEKLVNADII